jgi:2-polyprenyl-3-methyl-5-hydroxy-6-metoxy-1,4-benzoquinol methylase
MNSNKNYYSYYREEMLQFIPNNVNRLLDVGCGEGNFVSLLKQKQKFEAWGVEINNEIAKLASSKNIFDKIINTSVELSINELPDNYFDCVIFNDVIEHLVNPKDVLMSIKSKMTENGVLVASIPNVRYLPNIYQLLIHKDWKYDVNGGILDDTHLRFFTKKSIIRLFDEIGFEILKIEGINPIELLKYKILFSLSFGILEDTKYLQFAVIAKKK